MKKIKNDLSTEMNKVIEILQKEFPKLDPFSIMRNSYKEIERGDDRVFFGINTKIPDIFEDTLFKELTLVIRIKLVSKNDQYNDTGKDYYWAQASWDYQHPGGGYNGHSFCDISMNLDGSLISVRTDKEKVV